jgi:hypothetical protein
MERKYIYERYPVFYTATRAYSRSNSTNYPASSLYNASQLRVTTQVWSVRVIMGVLIGALGAMDAPVFVCLRSSCDHVIEIA